VNDELVQLEADADSPTGPLVRVIVQIAEERHSWGQVLPAGFPEAVADERGAVVALANLVGSRAASLAIHHYQQPGEVLEDTK
jgi:hypothetical protein